MKNVFDRDKLPLCNEMKQVCEKAKFHRLIAGIETENAGCSETNMM